MPLGHLDVRQASPRFCHFYPTHCKLLSNFFYKMSVCRQLNGNLMEVDVLRMLRYCRMSGTVISRKALRNRSPEPKRSYSALIKMDLTNPCPIKIYGDKRRWDGEVIDEGVHLQHEPELVRSCYELGSNAD